MSARLYRALQSLVLVLLGLFLLNKLLDGTVFWYINARFLPLTVIGAAGLLWLGRTLLFELRRGPEAAHENDTAAAQPPAPDAHDHASGRLHAHSHGADDAHPHTHRSPAALLIMIVPFVLGVLVPARPLGASAIDNKGLSSVAPLRAASSQAPLQLELASTERTVLDWARAFNQASNPAEYAGEPADVIGFVYHDPRLPEGQFLLGRFTLTCCVADAAAIGVIVDWPEAGQLPTNAWVRVRGTVQPGQLDGNRIPRIEAETLEFIPEPAQPYLYN